MSAHARRPQSGQLCRGRETRRCTARRWLKAKEGKARQKQRQAEESERASEQAKQRDYSSPAPAHASRSPWPPYTRRRVRQPQPLLTSSAERDDGPRASTRRGAIILTSQDGGGHGGPVRDHARQGRQDPRDRRVRATRHRRRVLRPRRQVLPGRPARRHQKVSVIAFFIQLRSGPRTTFIHISNREPSLCPVSAFPLSTSPLHHPCPVSTLPLSTLPHGIRILCFVRVLRFLESVSKIEGILFSNQQVSCCSSEGRNT